MRVVLARSNPVYPDPRVEKEANSLLNLGHQVRLVGWNRSSQDNRGTHGEIQVSNGKLPIRWFNINAAFGSGLKNLMPLISFQICLLGWLIKHRNEYDVIHACDFDTVIPSWLCSKLFNKKYVYDIFDYYVEAFTVPNALRSLIEKVDIHMINSADAVIIANESREKQIYKTKPKKLFVIHNSPELLPDMEDENSKVILSNSDKLKFVYVGILGPGRLLKEILEVFERHPECELHIGGFGLYENHIREIAEKTDNIFFYGRLEYDKVLNLEKDCDILFAVYNPFIPNHKYSSPNKLYEAMMLEKPIIVAKNTGIDEIVDSENIGLSIEYSKDAFEAAVMEMPKKRDSFGTMGQNAKRLYHEKYSWSIMHKRLAELYEYLGK